MKRRKIRRKKFKRHRGIFILSCVFILLLLSVGYGAFQSVVRIKTTGKVKTMYASDTIKKLLKNNSLTMFTDPFGNIRYTGSNDDVHNYACLVDENPCQDKNLFRIIGSFINIDDGDGKLETRVKVVKATEYSKDYWDASGSNNWARPATLNTTLNTTYYYNLDSTAQNLVGNTVWNLGGFYTAYIKPIESYNIERGSTTNKDNVAPITWIGKIALIYPSDYGYSSSSCYQNTRMWNNTGDDYRQEICRNSNWLFLNNSLEWFLTPVSNNSTNAFYVENNGFLVHGTGNVSLLMTIRPAFFLKKIVF